MCNTPKPFFVATFDVKRISRSKLHKYLLREKSEEKIFREISQGNACIYQQTKNGQSSLFLALAKNQENVIRRLMDIYENDYKVLAENGFNNKSAVLVAFGADDITFVDQKLSQISSETETENKNKFMILMKENNESVPRVKSLTPKTEDEQKVLLEIIEKLHKNGTFDVDISNTNGETLFLVAASQGLIWVLEKLLEFGARHDVSNLQNSAAFELACVYHQMETVKWYHKKFKPDLLKFFMEGQSLFNIAVGGCFEVFDYILSEIKRYEGEEHVEEIFARKTEYQDCNILMQAVNSGQHEFVLKCMKYEPNLSVCDESDNNLLHLTLKSWPLHENLCKTIIKIQPNLLLMEDSNQWTPLHLLATRNVIDEFKEVYQKYPTCKNAFFKHFVDSPTVQKVKDDVWCQTPGHSAFSQVVNDGYLEMAEFILCNHPDEFESAAYISGLLVILAQRSTSIEFIEKLQNIKHFDINVPDEGKKFPLMTALSEKKFEMFQHLLKSCGIKEINLMVEPYSKYNLLHYAIWRKAVEVMGVPFMGGCFPPDADSSEDESERKEAFCPDTSCIKLLNEMKEESDRKLMLEIFMDLLKRGVDVTHKAQYGSSLLQDAVDSDNLDVVRELLNRGLEIDYADENGNVVLHFVKSSEVFQALGEREFKPELINSKNLQGRTPIMNVVSLFGHDKVPADLFADFMKYNCDLNAGDNAGSKPIHAAQTEDWIKVLLTYGADISAINNAGENVVHLALRDQKWSLARFLLQKTEIDRFAVTNEDVSYLGYLSMGNLNHNQVFSGELSSYYDELVEKFINGKTLYGGPIVNNFIYNGDFKAIQHPKADLHQTEADGQTCLHRSITFSGHLEIVKFLVEKGLDINAVNESGFRPLMFCLDYGCSDVAMFLIEQKNVNLDLVNAYGFTALHYAARNGHISILCKILLAGADSTILNNENQSFFDLLTEFDKKLFSFYAIGCK